MMISITLSSYMCRIYNVNYEAIIMITGLPECMMIVVTDAAADNDDDEQDRHLCIFILLLSRFNTVAVAVLYC